MILAAALLALQTRAPIRVEVDARDEAVFSVAVPLPRLGSKDRELLLVGLEALSKGSQVYPPSLVAQVTEGRGIKCRLFGDEALVTVAVPGTSAVAGADLISSLVKEPSFLQEDLDASLSRLKGRAEGYWSTAMHEPGNLPAGAPRERVMEVFLRVFRPEKVLMAFGGRVGNADVSGEWALRTSDWTVPPGPRYPDYDLAPAPTSLSGGVSVCELLGSTLSAGDAALPAQMLALYALGAGKDSSLFRISRQRHTWSYRQEAYLWPVANGWEPRILVPMMPPPEAASRMDTLGKELLKDVEAWTEDDRRRALGMAEGNLLRGTPYGPLLLGDDPLGLSPEDQVTMAAFWQVKTGSPWDPQSLYQSLAKVDLPGLKAAAHAVLDQARPVVLPAG